MARTAAGTTGRRLHAALLVRTALGGLMLTAVPALALPGAPAVVATNTGGGAPVLTNPVAGTLNIQLNAPRTVLQYSGFTVGAAETVNLRFDNRSDLAVIHATSSAIQIDGTLASYVGAAYGGNVWLLSAAGVFIGGTARIDVGGLLASTSIPSNLLSSTGAVLTPTALSFDFGDGAGMVTVAAGAQVTGHGGTLALLAPSVRTAGTAQIGGGGDTSVLYGAAQRYTVRFVQQAGNDLDLLDFEVPGLTAGSTAAMPLMLAGTTNAGNVYVASVSRADAVRAVLDAQGSIGATVAGLEGGTVVLTAGGGIAGRAAAPLLAGGAFLHDLNTGTVTADTDIIVQATGTLDIGLTTAGRDLSLLSTGDAIGVYDVISAGRDLRADAQTALVADSAVAGRDATFIVHTGGLSFTDVTAGDDLRASAATADFGSATTTGLGPDSEGDGSNIVVTGDSVTLAEASAATDLIVTATDTIAIGFAGSGANAGRDLRLTGTAIEFGTLVAGRDLALTATDDGLDADGLGDPTPLTAGRDLLLTASGPIVAVGLTAPRDIVLDGASIDILTADAGRDLRIDVDGELIAGTVTAGRDATFASQSGGITFTDVTAGDDIRASAATADFGRATTTGLGPDSEGDGSNIVITGDSVTLAEGGAATDIRITATDTIAIGFNGAGASAGRDIVLSGAALQFGMLDAGRDLSLTATDAGLDVDELGAPTPLTAGRDLLLTAAGPITASNLTAPRDIVLSGTALDIGHADAGRDMTATATTGDAVIGSARVRNDLRIIAENGLAHLGSGEVGNDLIMRGHSVELGSLDGYTDGSGNGGYGYGYGYGDFTLTRDVILTATAGGILGPSLTVSRDVLASATAGIVLGDIDAGRDALIDAAGNVTLGSVVAANDVRLTGAVIGADAVRAGRDLTATATTSLTLVVAEAGDDVRLGGPAIDIDQARATGLGADTEGDASNIVATGGTITIEQAIAANDLLVTGTGVVTIGIGSGGMAIGIINGGMQDYFAEAGNDIVLTGASLLTGPLTAGRDVRLTATAGPIDGFDAIEAGRDVLATATGAIDVAAVTAGRDLALTGTTLANGPLSSGRDLLLTATVGGIAAGDISAVRDLTLDAAGALTAGTTTAGRNLVLAGASIAGGDATGGADVTATADAGSLTLGAVTAGDDIRLTANGLVNTGNLRADAATSDGDVDGANIVVSGTGVTVGTLAAGTDIRITATGLLTAGAATAGRDIVLVGGMLAVSTLDAGRDLDLTATAGSFTGPATLTAVRDLRIDAIGVTLDTASAGRDLTVDGHAGTITFASLTAGQDIALTAATVAGGSAVATRDLRVIASLGISGTLFQAGRNLILDPDEPIIVTTVRAGGNATLVGSSINVGTLEVGGTTAAVATGGGLAVDTFSGHAATFIATGKVDFGDATGTDIRIVGGDLDVRRSLVASNMSVETPGRMVLGGVAAPGETGFRLAAADIGRLRVSGIASFYAGLTTQVGNTAPPAGDLIVQDFAYDPANLPRLALFADRGHVVDIQGIVAPSDVGGALQIGDANPDGRFRPANIYVSGSLGTAELIANCFGRVVPANTLSLYTVGDVIFGDASFRSAVQGTAAGDIDIFAGIPATSPRTDDHLFAVTTRLTIQASGKIVSQNSASLTGAYVGIVLIGTGATGPIIDVGTAAAADLSGSIIDTQGFLRSGPLVARAAELGPGGVNGAIFRFNGCIVGGGICTAGGSDLDTPSEALRIEDYQPPRPIDITDSPLTTVLIADNIVGQGDRLTVVNDADAIVIRRSDAPGDGDTTKPQSAPDNCTVEPGGNGSQPRCPAPGGGR